jgi:hypothetical protein
MLLTANRIAIYKGGTVVKAKAKRGDAKTARQLAAAINALPAKDGAAAQALERAVIVKPPTAEPVRCLGIVPDGKGRFAVVEAEVPVALLKIRLSGMDKPQALAKFRLETNALYTVGLSAVLR